ncbi:1,2-phenylacetyl-CoA epoxidase subunit PaaC [Nocardioides pocheonensis]|uniref:1,2-phenylacetyl-CoA epoxidase subunit PaaC n=1 Tax=Nocardioides pocheonensis TaxID=661485 RepID=UPI001C82A41D|nr:1,2-phenylacetyl-CoA epoxidase subunit PaaC [Nocardioides pocheonensis]
MRSTCEAVATEAEYAVALADDALVASQRLVEWVARAPQIEEDVAIGNIALDLLGQARLLYQYAGSLTDPPRTEDDLAYFRDERAFRNVCLVERENGDFAVTMVRLLVLAAYQRELYDRLARSVDPTLAAIAAKAVKEVAYHRDHARQWVLRLGDGTPESHRRTQTALEAEWPWVSELFDGGWLAPALVERGVAVAPASLEEPVLAFLREVLDEATLAEPDPRPAVTAGREGRHTEALGHLLTELQHLARSHPGASW